MQLDRRLLIKHNLMHWDFVQVVPCCELDPEMNFLYVPKHTNLSTVLKGDAVVLDVQKISDEVHVETSQPHFQKILELDPLHAVSSNVWDIYKVLGIEAVREYLTRELVNETSGIHETHLAVLVDKMVFTGDIFFPSTSLVHENKILVYSPRRHSKTRSIISLRQPFITKPITRKDLSKYYLWKKADGVVYYKVTAK